METKWLFLAFDGTGRLLWQAADWIYMSVSFCDWALNRRVLTELMKSCFFSLNSDNPPEHPSICLVLLSIHPYIQLSIPFSFLSCLLPPAFLIISQNFHVPRIFCCIHFWTSIISNEKKTHHVLLNKQTKNIYSSFMNFFINTWMCFFILKKINILNKKLINHISVKDYVWIRFRSLIKTQME